MDIVEAWDFSLPADAWETKTWASIRPNEPDDRLHHLLRRACDPNAAAPDLAAIEAEARKVIYAPSQTIRPETNPLQIVNAALAAHPNTPPRLFAFLIVKSQMARRAFCCNSVAPFLLLENPALVASFFDEAQNALLNDAYAPPAWVRLLADGGAARVGGVYEDLRGAARMHVAFAGEAPQTEWEKEARNFYRAIAVKAAQDGSEEASREWFADLVELGLLPAWADGGKPFGPPWSEGRGLKSGFYDVQQWLQFKHAPGSEQEDALIRGFLTSKHQHEVHLLPRMAHLLRETASSDDLHQALRLWEETQAFGETVKDLILRHPAANDAGIIAEVATTWLPDTVVLNRSQTPPHLIKDLVKDKTAHSRRFARRHPNAPPDALDLSRQAFFDTFLKNGKGSVHDPLISLTVALLGKGKRRDIPDKGDHWQWTGRFEAVWLAPMTDEPLPGDEMGRTGRELIDHLCCDPNRIVRAAAKTRLADPTYRFSLWDEKSDG